MNFLLVDRILDLQPGKSTLAIKHITASDTYLTQDAHNRTMIISCIIGEALGQLCSWNVIKTSNFERRLIGGVVGEVRMFGDAYLGDTVVLENTIDALDLDNQVVNFHGVAKVGQRKLLEVNNGLGPLLPIADFGNVDDVKKDFQHLYRPGPLPNISEGQVIAEATPLQNNHLKFDRILQWEKGQKVVAQKNISRAAPYLTDHFPARPVLPLSLLLESQLQLAYPFIAELMGEPYQVCIKPRVVSRIKMGDFVEPGDIVITTMTLKKHQDKKLYIKFPH